MTFLRYLTYIHIFSLFLRFSVRSWNVRGKIYYHCYPAAQRNSLENHGESRIYVTESEGKEMTGWGNRMTSPWAIYLYLVYLRWDRFTASRSYECLFWLNDARYAICRNMASGSLFSRRSIGLTRYNSPVFSFLLIACFLAQKSRTCGEKAS